MRTAFINKLSDLMRKHDDIVTITADMGFSVFEELQLEFPGRFFNTGVTEQGTLGLSAGLAMNGYKVFIYAQAIFLTLRSFEQARLDIAYHNANVKIIGTAAGFWLNQLGVSHFALEDVGAMRLLPGMKIFTPGDPYEAEWATQKAYDTEGPVYMRLGKPDRIYIHKKKISCKAGEIISVRKGKSIALLSSGGLLPQAVETADNLKKSGINLSVYSVPSVRPLDYKALSVIVKGNSYIFTLEEHFVSGGLGTILSEFMTDNAVVNCRLHRFGVPDKYYHVGGSRDYLLDLSGLSVNKLTEKILAAVKHGK